MNRQKDLFDLFRENSDKITEQPTPRTWRRLERKLDAHRRRSQHDNNWTLGMVAALIGLVCLVGLFSYSYNTTNSNAIASQEPGPRFFEALEVNEQESQIESRKIIEYQKHYQERGQQIIEEGSREQKLIPNEEIGD